MLIVTAGGLACAVHVQHVGETMRPLPVVPVSGMPRFVCGVAVIRGAPTPVVDLRILLAGGDVTGTHGRFVTLELEERRVALAVDAVLGLRNLEADQLTDLPPLLQHAGDELVAAIGTADAQLLLVLRAARVVPNEVWMALVAEAEAR